jgi:hypothetical protein
VKIVARGQNEICGASHSGRNACWQNDRPGLSKRPVVVSFTCQALYCDQHFADLTEVEPYAGRVLRHAVHKTAALPGYNEAAPQPRRKPSAIQARLRLPRCLIAPVFVLHLIAAWQHPMPDLPRAASCLSSPSDGGPWPRIAYSEPFAYLKL